MSNHRVYRFEAIMEEPVKRKMDGLVLFDVHIEV
jgi:hypothetical protein